MGYALLTFRITIASGMEERRYRAAHAAGQTSDEFGPRIHLGDLDRAEVLLEQVHPFGEALHPKKPHQGVVAVASRKHARLADFGDVARERAAAFALQAE